MVVRQPLARWPVRTAAALIVLAALQRCSGSSQGNGVPPPGETPAAENSMKPSGLTKARAVETARVEAAPLKEATPGGDPWGSQRTMPAWARAHGGHRMKPARTPVMAPMCTTNPEPPTPEMAQAGKGKQAGPNTLDPGQCSRNTAHKRTEPLGGAPARATPHGGADPKGAPLPATSFGSVRLAVCRCPATSLELKPSLPDSDRWLHRQGLPCTTAPRSSSADTGGKDISGKAKGEQTAQQPLVRHLERTNWECARATSGLLVSTIHPRHPTAVMNTHRSS